VLSKSQFKPQVLACLREVEQTGEELILTDHGRPVVKIVPIERVDALADVQQRWQARLAEGVVQYDADEAVRPLAPELWGNLG
jgi:prevent-host-death family protein